MFFRLYIMNYVFFFFRIINMQVRLNFHNHPFNTRKFYIYGTHCNIFLTVRKFINTFWTLGRILITQATTNTNIYIYFVINKIISHSMKISCSVWFLLRESENKKCFTPILIQTSGVPKAKHSNLITLFHKLESVGISRI